MFVSIDMGDRLLRLMMRVMSRGRAVRETQFRARLCNIDFDLIGRENETKWTLVTEHWKAHQALTLYPSYTRLIYNVTGDRAIFDRDFTYVMLSGLLEENL